MIEVYEEIKIEFNQAMDSLTAEKGLKNLDAFKQKYQEAFDNITPYPRIAFGNKKVPKTTAIANTTSWFLCPGRLQNFCELKEVCYDKCREVMGSACQSRLNHDLWWRSNDAKTIAMFYIYRIHAYNITHPDTQVNLIRFQEVGDFRNQKDLQKMVNVSNIIFDELGINSYTYTHNKNLDFSIDRPHLCICGSGFMVDNKFTVVEPSKYDDYVKNHECIECPNKCELCNTVCSKKLGIEIVERQR